MYLQFLFRLPVLVPARLSAKSQYPLIVLERCVPHKTVLCGSAIYHDRRFIIKHMPKLDAFLHYRLIDVSTLKELVRRWYPKGKDLPKKTESHRALSDILESIEDLRHFRKHYFK